MMHKILFFTTLGLFLGCFNALAQPNVCINEYSASNISTYPDNNFEYHDWIELYNTTASNINIGGWYMSDNPANLTKWQIPIGTTVPANSYQFIFASSLNGVIAGEIHADFKLTQCKGEWLILSSNGVTVTDSVHLVRTQKDHSRGRSVNGSLQWAVFETPTPGYSNAFNTPYTAYTPKPTISPAPGFYSSAVSVSITAPNLTANETIYYTLDGSNPSTSGTRIAYTAPFIVNNTKIVRAGVVSTNPNLLPGFHDNSTFFINSTHTLPVISVSSEDFTGFFDGSIWGNIVSSFELFGDNAGSLLWEMEGEIRSHGNDSWFFDQKGIRFHAMDDYGYDNNIDTALFTDAVSANSNYSPRREYDVLIIRNAGSDNYPGAGAGLPSCHIRDAFAQSLARRYNLHLDTRRYQPCIVYINGQYWGLYEMRERVDSDYTEYYYGQVEKNVDMLEYWGGLTVRYGSDTAWTNIYNFMANNNLAIPANYAYVANRIDINSFIDYFIFNTFLVNSDWLNWNTSWWRGRKTPNNVKWKYHLWDMDNIYDLGQNYTGLGTTTWQADPCEPGTNLFVNDPDIHHSDMYRALFDNPQFVQQYYNRYADLAATVFNCDTLLNHLDALVADIDPEMPQHLSRWTGGSYSQWQANLQYLRSQIQGKCTSIIPQLVNCDSTITGSYNLVFMSDPPQSGQVKVNTVTPPLPYQATYFSGINTRAEALPFSGYEFSHWTLLNHTPTPSTTDSVIQFSITTTDTIVAHFSPVLGNYSLVNLETFNIFPNPSDGNIHLQIFFNEPQDAIIEITNTLGARIKTIPISGDQFNLDLELTNLPAGMYLATIRGEKGGGSRKFVVGH